MPSQSSEQGCLLRPALIEWPSQAERRSELADAGIPCLLVIDRGADIPLVDDGEDWTYRDSDERDVAARLAHLVGRSRRSSGHPMPVISGGLDVDARRVAARLLGSAGHLVPRADLLADDLDAVVERLRPVLAGAGWTVLVIGRSGFLVERDGAAPG